ncbi:hypothetical protein D3C84_974220 [compost metagenome]
MVRRRNSLAPKGPGVPKRGLRAAISDRLWPPFWIPSLKPRYVPDSGSRAASQSRKYCAARVNSELTVKLVDNWLRGMNSSLASVPGTASALDKSRPDWP